MTPPSKPSISPSLSENNTNTNTMNTPIIKEAIAWFESLPPDPKLSPEATSLALAVALHIVRQQTLRTEDWISHDGSERPVSGSTRIRVKYSDESEDTGRADDWGVSWTNAITHYKILDTND